MRIRPVHTWWLGTALFAPSLLVWAFSLGLSIYRGRFNLPPHGYHALHTYLPLLAAMIGFATLLVCLRILRAASWRRTCWLFAAYLVVMLAWGVVDIRHQHYQMGGHEYPNGPLIDGHTHYWHLYITWYFLPYRLIE